MRNLHQIINLAGPFKIMKSSGKMIKELDWSNQFFHVNTNKYYFCQKIVCALVIRRRRFLFLPRPTCIPLDFLYSRSTKYFHLFLLKCLNRWLSAIAVCKNLIYALAVYIFFSQTEKKRSSHLHVFKFILFFIFYHILCKFFAYNVKF